MENEKEEIQWIKKIQKKLWVHNQVSARKKQIKVIKKEILQVYLQLGKQTYECFVSSRENGELSPLASIIQQKIAVMEELEREISLIKQGKDEEDFLDTMF